MSGGEAVGEQAVRAVRVLASGSALHKRVRDSRVRGLPVLDTVVLEAEQLGESGRDANASVLAI
jgi:hypothetical protein